MVDGVAALVVGVGSLLAGLAEAVGAVASAGGQAAEGSPAGFPAVRGVAPLAADLQLLNHLADALPGAVL